MSIARRWAKCKRACLRWALQLKPAGQRLTASDASRTACDPQTGQCVGIRNGRASAWAQLPQSIQALPE